MDLLLDIGNSCVKWARWDGVHLSPMARARHYGALPLDVLAAWSQMSDIERVAVASVGPATVTRAIANASQAYWQCKPLQLHAPADATLKLAYDEPQRLGIDRWLALIATRTVCSDAALIVDAGTAITYDLLLADGTHLGGAILPGIELMRASLARGTQISPHAPRDTDAPWGTDTGGAIAAAILHAPAALAERLLDRLREHADTPRLLLTGGDAERLLPVLRVPATHCPDLVLRGLACQLHRAV